MLSVSELNIDDEVRNPCTRWRIVSRLGPLNGLNRQSVFALGAWRLLDDMDVLHRRGMDHGHLSHSRGAPHDDSGRISRRSPAAMRRRMRESRSRAERTGTQLTCLTLVSRQGHGLRLPSLAFDPLRASPSLRAGQCRADHDRGEKRGVTTRPRGRTVGTSPVRSIGTVRRMSAWAVRGRQPKPMEDG